MNSQAQSAHRFSVKQQTLLEQPVYFTWFYILYFTLLYFTLLLFTLKPKISLKFYSQRTAFMRRYGLFFFAVSVNFIDYVGSYLSYIIIAIALFGGMYDNIQPSALSGEISRVSISL